ncbi:MAG: TetR/AcrR family transcriptional regulator [Humibacillus sp.]|nr:TetR/AcrR family transcriptional regulator [Humibacillus sp.]MDN5775945.1 TetR/AcrR family transcriptional regulator [Humibacillus sp.]
MSTGRPYDNSSRAEAARLTRRRIIEAAREMLLLQGYHATSVIELAAAAGVSAQTVYNAVGGKAQVVKAVYDVLLVGDDDPVAMPDRPEFRAMSLAPDRESFLQAYAALCATIYRRTGALLGVLLAQGAGGDQGLRDFVATIDAERRAGNTNVIAALEEAHGLHARIDRGALTDILWTITAPEIYDRFVRRCGWTHEQYAAWLGEAFIATFERAAQFEPAQQGSVPPAAGSAAG